MQKLCFDDAKEHLPENDPIPTAPSSGKMLFRSFMKYHCHTFISPQP